MYSRFLLVEYVSPPNKSRTAENVTNSLECFVQRDSPINLQVHPDQRTTEPTDISPTNPCIYLWTYMRPSAYANLAPTLTRASFTMETSQKRSWKECRGIRRKFRNELCTRFSRVRLQVSGSTCGW